MLFTGTQYGRIRMGFELKGSPITESTTLCEVTKGDNKWLKQIVVDADFEAMVADFEAAANTTALDAWYDAIYLDFA